LPVHPRHPYAGTLVYTAFSGSHQDAIKKGLAAWSASGDATGARARWEVPYLPIDPADVGRTYEAVIRVNSQSGKGGVAYLLETDHGLRLPRAHQVEFAALVQARTEASGEELSSDAIRAAFEAEYLDPATHGLREYRLMPGGAEGEWTIEATVRLDEAERRIEGAGNGPIAAMVRALADALETDVSIVDYSEHALTAGADAMAVAYVEVAVDGARGLGVGRHPDIVTASLHAVLGAVAGARSEGGLTEPSVAEYHSIRMNG
jgi:2-isopropylmalate synthase